MSQKPLCENEIVLFSVFAICSFCKGNAFVSVILSEISVYIVTFSVFVKEMHLFP